MSLNYEFKIAIELGLTEEVKDLIKAGVDLDRSLDQQGCTALIRVTIYNHFEIAEILIDAGAGLNITNVHGKTALMYALEENRKKIIVLLIKAGANLNISDRHGNTIFVYIKELHYLPRETIKLTEKAISERQNGERKKYQTKPFYKQKRYQFAASFTLIFSLISIIAFQNCKPDKDKTSLSPPTATSKEVSQVDKSNQ